MRFRKLRIAWSVFWGLACVLLIVLWVRTHWRSYVVFYDPYAFGSGGGGIMLHYTPPSSVRGGLARIRVNERGNTPWPWFPWFSWKMGTQETWVNVPIWFAVMIVMGLSAAPWLRWRFSLRTLLIATTLVAVVLGLVVWAARK